MALTFGACPVCGDHVPRTVQLAHGLQKEIFHCPEHGRMPYEPRAVPLDALAAGGRPLGIPDIAGFSDAQWGTGLELVH